MYKETNFSMFLIAASLGFVACSTTTRFSIPAGTTLEVYERPVELNASGEWKTKPFFWTAAGGVPYRLEKNGAVVDEGKLTAKFRIASIFWPPAAIIYWPMGFRFEHYDLVNPNSARGVRSTKAAEAHSKK
jgi:hypothetical protein